MHLRGIHVIRRLPDELYAGHEAHGRLIVRNTGRWTAWGLRVVEEGGTGAGVTVARLGPGEETALATGWTVGDRGVAELTGLQITSRWPFGWFERTVDQPLPAEIVVYPRPLGGGTRIGHGLPGDADTDDPRPGDGDFAGLRPYQPGDSLRLIHWPTSARVGEPVIVTRSGAGSERCVVNVDASAEQFEREVSRACGEVLRGFQRGAAVGLIAPSGSYEARAGASWRRVLLGVLAVEPTGDR
jgi:uncharacterized protein (DUF58 family)